MSDYTASYVDDRSPITGWSVMVTGDASTRTFVKDTKSAVNRLDGIHRLTDDDIRIAISYRDEDLNNRQYGADVGVVILLVVNLIAFVSLFYHVVSR